MNPRAGYALMLIPASLFFLAILFLAYSSRPRPNPLKQHRPCLEIVVAHEWYCSDGYAWLRQDGSWLRIGRLSPLPKIPAS